MNIIRYLLILSFIFISFNSFSQEGKRKKQGSNNWNDTEDYFKEPVENRFLLGGNFGATFGTITAIELTPLLGYKLSKSVVAGIGTSYYYYKNSYTGYEHQIYGGCVFSRYYFIEEIFGHIEAEFLNVESYKIVTQPPVSYYTEAGRKWIGNYLVGGGYSQSFGNGSSAYILILWNLNETTDSPYSNPIFKIGFLFAL